MPRAPRVTVAGSRQEVSEIDNEALISFELGAVMAVADVSPDRLLRGKGIKGGEWYSAARMRDHCDCLAWMNVKGEDGLPCCVLNDARTGLVDLSSNSSRSEFSFTDKSEADPVGFKLLFNLFVLYWLCIAARLTWPVAWIYYVSRGRLKVVTEIVG